jgi:hypothetical protein
MRKPPSRLRRELRQTFERPGRLRGLTRRALIREFISSVRGGGDGRAVEGSAATERSGAFLSKRYGSYDDYAHQAAKLETVDLGAYWDTVEDLVRLLEGEGFTRVSSSSHDKPWVRVHMAFSKR